jgi:choline dehydrogenase-like flavoprotein
MIIDGRSISHGAAIAADICIVGSGPAGMTLALRLVSLGASRILLVESGGLSGDKKVQELAKGVVEGFPYFPLEETRIRRLGGSSWSWGGVVCPLDRHDFESRSWVPHSGWPLSYAEIADYYPEAAALLLGEAADDTLIVPPVQTTSAVMVPAPICFTAPKRFGKDHRPELACSRHIAVYTNTTVLALRPGSDSNRIVAADAGCLTGTQWQISARVFVLACGGIENARLLLLTNCKHGTAIGDRNEQLGRFFMEHPRFTDRLWMRSRMRPLEAIVTGRSGKQPFGRLQLNEREQRDNHLLNYHANLSFGYAGQTGGAWNSVRRLSLALRKPWSDSPYFQDAGGGPTGIHWKDLHQIVRHPVNATVSLYGSGLKPSRLRRFIAITSGLEQAPDPANRVTLSKRRADSFGLPQVEVHWRLGEAERRTYEHGLRRVVDHLDALLPGLKTGRLERANWSRDVLGTWHHIGTTRMGSQATDGVVNANLKVHETGNLYIAGSSVFPTAGAASPTLTITALSLRLAKHLAAAATNV